MRLCGRWAEFIEGKPKLSTWQSFGNWLVSLSSGGCPIGKNGSDLTRLKVMDVKSLVTLGLGCLQERQENILHALEMWQRSVQFTSLTTRYKSAKSLTE